MRWTNPLAIASTLLVLGTVTAPANGVDFPGLGPKGDLVSIEIEQAGQPVLRGHNARKQLVVTGVYSSGQRRDLTHEVTYGVDKPNVVAIASDGIVTPQADGEVTATATAAGDKTASIVLHAERCNEELPINFVNEVVPIFTRLGCNSGGCHGKSDGQNGFKLSLLGFYPDDDYEYLVHEARGRRIFPAEPEFSLLLLKPSNMLPHGGGKRMSAGTYEWELIASWIRQGMPLGSEDDPKLERIEVVPPVREMNFNTKQQLSVIGHYSDGSARDVSRLASYEANQPEMASVGDEGRVGVLSTPGEAAVMVRFQGEVSVFRAVIPQGSPVQQTPPEKNFVDHHVIQRLRQLGIPPSPLCDDATFIRRVSVDLTGRLPEEPAAEQFLADANPNKRDALVDRLVDSPGYSEYFANKWGAVLRNKRRNGNDIAYTFRFHTWIRQALADNMPYDQFVRSVLTASGEVESHPPVAWYREVNTTSEQMEDTAQLFLGMRLACAKCHHHPFERWSQQDYYQFEAFFSQVGLKVSRFNPQTNLPDMVYLKGNVPGSTNPRTKQPVKPAGLGAEPLDIPAYEDARQRLVDWMAAADNPLFATALVNRYWKHFFGRGIVDPEDDLRVTNPPSNPELLDALSQHFRDSKFDLKDLVRTICKSSTYQLSSEPTEFNATDQQNFSSFYARRMPAEVLYDALNHVVGVPAGFGGVPQGTTAVQLPDNGFSNYFLQVFGKPEAESACECERSPEANLAQSLHLLNSGDMQNRLQNGQGFAATLARDTQRTDEAKATSLYLRAFARKPTADELQLVCHHVAKTENKSQAWEDALWAVLNAKEFQFIR
ncbi:MAG: DUF1549 and DUF1553 domain-containing protein [Planctomycetota bacterium]|nr:DUF1549 and DUF1553 domain-containing protein [Planctomycetota bacterium]